MGSEDHCVVTLYYIRDIFRECLILYSFLLNTYIIQMRVTFSLLLLAVLMDVYVETGKILSQAGRAVQNSLANQSMRCTYTFTFRPSSSVNLPGSIMITFPKQYSPGLGITTVSSTLCNLPCTVSDRTVTFTL